MQFRCSRRSRHLAQRSHKHLLAQSHQSICGRERRRAIRVYSRSPCGCGDKCLDGRPAPRIRIVGLVALTVDPVELARLIPVAMAAATAKYVAQGRRDARHTGLRLARQTGFRCLAARPSTSNAVLIGVHLKRERAGRSSVTAERMPQCSPALVAKSGTWMSSLHAITDEPDLLGRPVGTRNRPGARYSSQTRLGMFLA